MEFSISKEATIFLYSALAGILICVVYDLFRILRKKVRTGRMLTDIQDIVFWTIATVIMFFIILFVNNGQVRWYEFFGVFLGAVFYKFTVSQYIIIAIGFFIEIIAKFFILFFKILLTPLAFMYNIISRCILTVCLPVYRFLKIGLKRIRSNITSGVKRAKTAVKKK